MILKDRFSTDLSFSGSNQPAQFRSRLPVANGHAAVRSISNEPRQITLTRPHYKLSEIQYPITFASFVNASLEAYGGQNQCCAQGWFDKYHVVSVSGQIGADSRRGVLLRHSFKLPAAQDDDRKIAGKVLLREPLQWKLTTAPCFLWRSRRARFRFECTWSRPCSPDPQRPVADRTS